MKYISINLYRKVIEHALSEGMTMEDFNDLPIPVGSMKDMQVVPADIFFELRNTANQVVSADVEKVLGRKATDFSEYVRNTVRQGVRDKTIPQSI